MKELTTTLELNPRQLAFISKFLDAINDLDEFDLTYLEATLDKRIFNKEGKNDECRF